MKPTYTFQTFLGWSVLLALTTVAHALPTTNLVLAIDGPWRYSAANVDAEDWTSPGYDDSAWAGPSNSLFFIETNPLIPAANNTSLPPRSGGGPLPCYYFRTAISVTNAEQAVSLNVSHLVDDGAIFYLNGVEIQRVRMATGTVVNSTEAYTSPPSSDATNRETFCVVRGLRSALQEGTNVIAARVHQQGTNSSDVIFGAQVSVVQDPDPVIHLIRGPYQQICTPSSIVIRWRTDLEENSQVRYGTSLADMRVASFDGALVTEHEVQVTNLTPDTLYYYSVGSDTRVLAGGDASCTIRTYPVSGQPKPLRIWATGDAGTANANEQAVVNAFESLNGSHVVDAWLQLGDNAYDSGTDAQYQAAMFDMCSPRLRQTPVWTTMANHETYSTDWNGLHPYLNIFTMPTLGEAGGVASHTKLYYSFDIGTVHFISLDAMLSSRAPNGDMANWLRSDLAATTNRWLIAFFHHPPYTKGSHNSDKEIELVEMRQNIVPILEAGGVDLVLNGHSHSYERSFLLNGHYGLSSTLTNTMILNGGSGQEVNGVGAYVKPEAAVGTPVENQGTVYVVAGSSGKTSGGALNHPAMFVSTNRLGSVVLDITTNRLDAIFLRNTGATNDWFTIIKANYAPVASNLVYVVSGDVSTNLLLAAGDVNRNPVVSYEVGSLPTNGLASAFDAASGTLTYTPAHGSTNSDSFSFMASDGSLSSRPGVVTIHVLPPADTDGNGLPDDWETRYGITDSAGDPDRDGVTNVNEYRAGTDPKDAASWLRMTQILHGQSPFQVVWSSVGGTRYRVLYSDGDANGGFNNVFTPLPQAVTEEMDPGPTGKPGILSFTDDFTLTGAPPSKGCRYFRISVVR